MARYSPEQKAQTRNRIVKKAAKLFRKNGYVATGVDGLMGAVKLTAGGFYKHFESKDALLAEAIVEAFQETRTLFVSGLEELSDRDALREMVKRYLSRSHRDCPEDGCAMPAIASEAGRCDESVRKIVENEFLKTISEMKERIAPLGKELTREDRAIAIFALCMGAMILSRAVASKELSDKILKVSSVFAAQDISES